MKLPLQIIMQVVPPVCLILIWQISEGKLIKAARGTYKAANLVQSMLKYQTDFAAKES